jgi:hypothetical protein
MMGAALLSFNFRYWAFVHRLGSEYCNAGRDWSHTQAQFEAAARLYPTLFPDLAMRSLREGVPLSGVFASRRRDFIRRYLYNNHPPLQEALDDSRQKFASEEALSFHLVFPKFVALFIPGVMVSPISWNKGRLIIDASSPLAPDDTGAPNTHIPPNMLFDIVG